MFPSRQAVFCSADFDMDFANLSVPQNFPYIVNIEKRAKSSVPCHIFLGKLCERGGNPGVTGVKPSRCRKTLLAFKVYPARVWTRPLSRPGEEFFI